MDGGAIDDLAGGGEDALIADAAAGEARAGQAALEGPCANCGTALVGKHCHVCGQVADDLKRPIWALFHDALEGLFSVDGRFLRTVPPLLLRPGLVTQRYLAGARARFVQPFRLFLFASLAFLLAVSLATGDLSRMDFDDDALEPAVLDEASAGLDEARAELEAQGASTEFIDRAESAIADARAESDENGATDAELRARELARFEERELDKCRVRQQMTPEDLDERCRLRLAANAETADGEDGFNFDFGSMDGAPLWLRRTVVSSAVRLIDDPSLYFDAVQRWTSRVLIALFPIYAALLGLMHFWKRRFYFYDHMIVSLHFHAFMFFLLTFAIAASSVLPWALMTLVVLVWGNFYLYKVHRLVYGCGRFTSALRTIVLDGLYFFVLLFALAALLIGGFLAV